MEKRKLASVQVIETLSPIQGADRIEVATMRGLGWECVVKKGDFKIGDTVVYIEIDSKVPPRPEFEFLRERKFKVKTIKLRKQISQGLIVPMTVLPDPSVPVGIYSEGDDVTEVLGVTNYAKDMENEDAVVQSPVLKWLMRFRTFRFIYHKLNTNTGGNWPVEFAGPKTDETRIQVVAKHLMEHYNDEWYITEKLDGSSSTFFTYMARKWGRMQKCFGVCSRNVWLKKKNEGSFWKMADKYDLSRKLLIVDNNISLQGEVVGPSIQKNKYGLPEVDLYIFNIRVAGILLPLEQSLQICDKMGVKLVPVVKDSFIPVHDIGEKDTVQQVVQAMVEMSKGKSKLANRNREGIVVRLKSNPEISFKVINPDFLLEEKDE